MTTTLMTEVTVADLCDGFVYSELEQKGLFGWGGRLVIQPEYQRNYIYADGKKGVAVVARGLSLRVRSRPQSTIVINGNEWGLSPLSFSRSAWSEMAYAERLILQRQRNYVSDIDLRPVNVGRNRLL